MGKVVGNGSSAPGLKETWRTWLELTIEWMAATSYVAEGGVVSNMVQLKEIRDPEMIPR